MLVSLAIITVLIGILLPSFAMVRESARRVKCSSNLRQIGLSLQMYGHDSAELLPPSVFLPGSVPGAWQTGSTGGGWMPELMDTVRTDPELFTARPWGQWDGLGVLYASEYLGAPGVYYCPSHPGTHAQERYERAWMGAVDGEIISNYQYRGIGPNGQRRLYQINPNAALVTDTLRSFDDLNHKGGFNLLQAGLAVNWFEDAGDEVASIMSRSGGGNDSELVNDAWQRFDGVPGTGGPSQSPGNPSN